jgi:aspartyl-tRNA(Asn)/glutamyl-tRNA(Gln) amidotransferase subunit C
LIRIARILPIIIDKVRTGPSPAGQGDAYCRKWEIMESEIVEKVARVARLELTEAEIKEFAKDLEEVLEYFSMLDEASGADEYDFNPVKIQDVLREDSAGQDIEPELLTKMMDTYEDWVRGPRLI